MEPKVLEVTDDEIRLLRSALRSYLAEFGHEEAEIVDAVKKLLAKLPQPGAAVTR